MEKQILALLLAVTLALSLAACGSGKAPENVNSTSSPVPAATTVSETTAPPKVVKPLSDSGTLGEFDVQIHDFELSQDYSGNSAILIGFTFTNNSKETTSAMVELLEQAYQNGLQLDTTIVMSNENYNSSDSMKDLKPGASIDLKCAYSLISDTAPVEFEISQAFSFSDDKLGKTFEISDGGITELSAAPVGDTTESVGGYTVSIVSHKITEDYEGKKAVLFELGFTNNSDRTTSFISSIDFSAFQNGVELETAILTNDDSGIGASQMRNIKPGAGTSVKIAFVLTSDTSPVEIEIEEFMSFSSDKVEAEISIA